VIRRLIVNADDFGRSPAINRGVAEGHERGIVTSASLMVRWPAALEAAAYARAHPGLGVGLHFDLAEWRFAGEWEPVYQVLADEDPVTVGAEFDRQLDEFRKLMGRPPSHLDSHQHVHRDEPARSVLLAAGLALGVPVRELSPGITYRGDFYGQSGRGDPYPEGITVDALLALIESVPPGVTELGCHPAAEPELESSYSVERPRELAALCDPRVAALVAAERIELCSFAPLAQSRS
jgi:predicted glycoside hydrolase/deacetylase ChbG (UPF0249 family)